MDSNARSEPSPKEWHELHDVWATITPADAENIEPEVIEALAEVMKGENETELAFMVKGRRFDVDSLPTPDQRCAAASILAALTHEKPEPV